MEWSAPVPAMKPPPLSPVRSAKPTLLTDASDVCVFFCRMRNGVGLVRADAWGAGAWLWSSAAGVRMGQARCAISATGLWHHGCPSAFLTHLVGAPCFYETGRSIAGGGGVTGFWLEMVKGPGEMSLLVRLIS